jgi:hypothetical protein
LSLLSQNCIKTSSQDDLYLIFPTPTYFCGFFGVKYPCEYLDILLNNVTLNKIVRSNNVIDTEHNCLVTDAIQVISHC